MKNYDMLLHCFFSATLTPIFLCWLRFSIIIHFIIHIWMYCSSECYI